MQEPFERAKYLRSRLGYEPRLITPSEMFATPSALFGEVFSGIDMLSRALLRPILDELSQAHLERLREGQREELLGSFSMLLGHAETVRSQSKLPPREYKAEKGDLFGLMRQSSELTQYIASCGLEAHMPGRYHRQSIAEWAMATLDAFIAYQPLNGMMANSRHAASSARAGLESLEKALMPRAVDEACNSLIELLGFGTEGARRQNLQLILRELMMTAYRHEYQPDCIAALAGLLACWLGGVHRDSPQLTGEGEDRIEARRRTLQEHTASELEIIAGWLARRTEYNTPADHRQWLLDELPMIEVHLGWW